MIDVFFAIGRRSFVECFFEDAFDHPLAIQEFGAPNTKEEHGKSNVKMLNAQRLESVCQCINGGKGPSNPKNLQLENPPFV